MSKSLYGAEIFAEGTWNGLAFTSEDLDAIVTSFDALGLAGRVPLKFGHNPEQPMTDGQPALGWVSRVYRQGNKLLADFTDMPTSIYEMVRAGMYKFVSVELLKNVQAGTRTIPWVLDAVALLGADQPAVGTLKDLQSLTMTRKLALRARARVAFQRDTKFFSTGVPKGMEKAEVEAAIAAALKAQETALTAKFTAQLDTKVAEVKAEGDKALAKERAENHRAQIKAKFETAIKAEALLPAKRESFYKFNRVEDDAFVVDIKLEDVDAYIEEFSDAAKLAAARKKATAGSEETADPAEVKMSAAEKVVHRARKLCFGRNQDPTKFEHYTAAVQEVLKADKALGEAYKRLDAAA